MERSRLIVAAGLALLTLLWALSGINDHGFWFDEAYTARLAALAPARLLAGAARDIHPPGWPLLSWFMLHLPLPAEVALRLPSCAALAGLVGVLAARSPAAGVALLAYGPLFEQATQARPYAVIALGLVGIVRLVERRAWLATGILVGAVASLHALSGALAAAVLAGSLLSTRPSRSESIRLFVPILPLTAWWAPAFAQSAAAYVQHPWYPTAAPTTWWTLADGGGAALAALIVVLSRYPSVRTLAPVLLASALLVGLQVVGVGVEPQKTGLILLPLLLATLRWTNFDHTVATLAALATIGTRVALPARPDLREAYLASQAVDQPIPVLSVFASEAAWYFRDPSPLPSAADTAGLARRMDAVLEAQAATCLLSVALPGSFPKDSALVGGVRTIQRAAVTGLDVRLVGGADCAARGVGAAWADSPTANPNPKHPR